VPLLPQLRTFYQRMNPNLEPAHVPFTAFIETRAFVLSHFNHFTPPRLHESMIESSLPLSTNCIHMHGRDIPTPSQSGSAVNHAPSLMRQVVSVYRRPCILALARVKLPELSENPPRFTPCLALADLPVARPRCVGLPSLPPPPLPLKQVCAPAAALLLLPPLIPPPFCSGKKCGEPLAPLPLPLPSPPTTCRAFQPRRCRGSAPLPRCWGS
jgi:hypothetical protein